MGERKGTTAGGKTQRPGATAVSTTGGTARGKARPGTRVAESHATEPREADTLGPTGKGGRGGRKRAAALGAAGPAASQAASQAAAGSPGTAAATRPAAPKGAADSPAAPQPAASPQPAAQAPAPGALRLRVAHMADWPALWPILAEVIAAADTFALPPDLAEEAARGFWLTPPPDRVILAEAEGVVLGTARMGANRPGPGDHVATASYMVAAGARGRGVGRALVEETIRWAAAAGFDGIQFNAVAGSNRGAIALYESLGFAIVGTVPGAFRHPAEGKVALHVMYRTLA